VEKTWNLLSIYYSYRDNVSRVDTFRTGKFCNEKQSFAFCSLLLFPFRPIAYTPSVSMGSDICHVVSAVSTLTVLKMVGGGWYAMKHRYLISQPTVPHNPDDPTRYSVRKIQLDATYYFIVLLIGSTCFGHYYAHHQELATMMLITTLVVSFLAYCGLEARRG